MWKGKGVMFAPSRLKGKQKSFVSTSNSSRSWELHNIFQAISKGEQ